LIESKHGGIVPLEQVRVSGAILAGFVSLSVQGPVIARSLEARHVAG
jgi:hypothetical protein